MAWVKEIECKSGDGKLQPTQVVAQVKIFTPNGALPVVQIDTYGSEERKIPGKQSQTLQLGKEAAFKLYKILKETYGF
ncbi:hypothetical protein [Hyphomicrobium sp. DY-1]|jgi:hypothetical protein|uniref:hypothetical protein n=1 Tax=Hyphomicrobium sp. DY-1 TaxID=3075650 RepID=UPI0039C2F28D